MKGRLFVGTLVVALTAFVAAVGTVGVAIRWLLKDIDG